VERAPRPRAEATLPEHHLRVARTARYVLLGDDPPSGARPPRTSPPDTDPGADPAPELWVACHGYRQLARYFARPFEAIAGPARRVAVPEGLSRFYVDDDGGPHGPEARVGATWMTREDRLAEIDDYVAYLDALVAHLAPGPRSPVTAFGFSQGAATASRWAAYGRTEIDRLVLWGGLPAHDLDLAAAGPRLAHLDIILARGAADGHLSEAAVTRVVDGLHAAGLPGRAWTYDGAHKVEGGSLTSLVAELAGGL
jgi:predicted esterase